MIMRYAIAGGLSILMILIISAGCSLIKQEDKLYTIGIATWGSSKDYNLNVEGFKQGLAQSGFIDGKNVQFLTLTADANLDKQIEIAEDFQKRNVDLIYSLTTRGTLTLKAGTNGIPIVFSIVSFPVESGVIDSLADSGNNLVGTRNYIPAQVQFEYFLQLVPSLKKIAFVRRSGESNSKFQLQEFFDFLKGKKIDIVDVEAIDALDMERLLSATIDDVDAVYASCDTLVQLEGKIINIIALKSKKPVFSCVRERIYDGGLMGVIADQTDIGRKAGIKAAKILEGAKPSSLVTESPTNEYVVINKKTAEEIGIEIPEFMLTTAEEIIS